MLRSSSGKMRVGAAASAMFIVAGRHLETRKRSLIQRWSEF
jgi:hypothetical protein